MQVNKILNIEQAITSNPDETTEVISGYKVVEKLAPGIYMPVTMKNGSSGCYNVFKFNEKGYCYATKGQPIIERVWAGKDSHNVLYCDIDTKDIFSFFKTLEQAKDFCTGYELNYPKDSFTYSLKLNRIRILKCRLFHTIVYWEKPNDINSISATNTWGETNPNVELEDSAIIGATMFKPQYEYFPIVCKNGVIGFSTNKIESEVKDLAYCKTIQKYDSDQ